MPLNHYYLKQKVDNHLVLVSRRQREQLSGKSTWTHVHKWTGHVGTNESV